MLGENIFMAIRHALNTSGDINLPVKVFLDEQMIYFSVLSFKMSPDIKKKRFEL